MNNFHVPTSFKTSRLAVFTFLFSLAGVSFPQSTSTPTPIERQAGRLQLKTPVDRELGPGQMDVFLVDLAAGQFARVVAEQKGVDIVVTVLGPKGKENVVADSWNGKFGPETASWIALDSGTYQVRISEQRSDVGRYQIELKDLRPPTDDDHKRIEAESRFLAAKQLEKSTDKNKLQEAIKAYQGAAKLWEELKDEYARGICLLRIGDIGSNLGGVENGPEGSKAYRDALSIFRTAGDRRLEASALLGQAKAESRSSGSWNDGALEDLAEAISLLTAVGEVSDAAAEFSDIGKAYAKLGKTQKALDYYCRALLLIHASADHTREARVLQDIGSLSAEIAEGTPTSRAKERDAGELQLRAPQERETGTGIVDVFTVKVAAGQFVHAVVHQEGAEIVATLAKPDGKVIPSSNSVDYMSGSQPISWLASEPGIYQLRVSNADISSEPGKYQIELTDLRTPTGDDLLRFGAESSFSAALVFDQYDRATEKYEQAASLWHRLKDNKMEALCFRKIGLMYWLRYGSLAEKQPTVLDKYSQELTHWLIEAKQTALNKYSQAFALYHDAQQPLDEAEVSVDLGKAYLSFGEEQKALEKYSQALALYRDAQRPLQEAEVLVDIGKAYLSLKDGRKALEWYLRALTTYHALGDKSYEAVLLWKTAAIYSSLGDQENASNYLGRAYAILPSIGGRSVNALASHDTTGATKNPTSKAELYPHVRLGSVKCLAFSPSGRYVIAGSDDHTSRLWEVKSGYEVGRFVGHTSSVTSVAFSPDERWVATGSDDTTARLWDVATGKELRRFRSSSMVHSVAFSPDGRFLLTGHGEWHQELGVDVDTPARLWEVATGAEVRRFTGHSSSISSVAFSPDGQFVLTDDDHEAILWTSATGKQLRKFNAVSAVFSPDGQIILTHDGKQAHLWGLASGKELSHFADEATSSVFSPDGRFILSSEKDNTARLFAAKSGRELSEFGEHSGSDSSEGPIAISPDGRSVLTADGVLWDTATGAKLRQFGDSGDVAGSVGSAVFSPDGHSILTGSDAVRLWDGTSRSVKRLETDSGSNSEIDTSGAWNSVAFSPDGHRAVAGHEDGAILLWDVESGLALEHNGMDAQSIVAVAFSPNGRLVLGVSGGQLAHHVGVLYDAASFRDLRPLFENKDSGGGNMLRDNNTDLFSTAFSPDGRFVVANADDNAARLCDTITGKNLHLFRGHTQSVAAVAISRDGRFVLTGSRDETARLWSVSSGKELRRFLGHVGTVRAVSFAPNGHQVVTGGEDGTTRLWDVANGKQLCQFESAAGAINSTVFSPNGKFVLTASDDGMTRLLKPASCELVANLISFGNKGWAVVSPDGRFDTNELDGQVPLHWVSDKLNPLPLEAFMRDYFTPRLLALILNDTKLPPVANIADITNRVQPLVEISKVATSANDPTRATVSVSVSVVKGNGIESGAQDLRIFRDGQLVDYHEGTLSSTTYAFNDIQLPLSKKKVVFTAYAFNAARIKSRTVRHEFDYAVEAPPHRKAYLLQVGVNHYYRAEHCELNYSANDANRTRIVLDRVLKARGFEVHATELVSTIDIPGASKDQISDTLAAVAKQAKPDDVFFLSFSGHGYSSPEGKFYILPSDILGSCSNPDEKLLQNAISSDELADWLRPIDAGEMVVILDSCYSAKSVEANDFKPGPMGNKGLGQLAYDKRIRILAASQSDQEALEDAKLEQGLLSYVLIRRGLEDGKADWQPADGKTTLGEWLSYAVEQVPTIKDSGMGRAAVPNTTRRLSNKPSQAPAIFDFSENDDLVLQVQDPRVNTTGGASRPVVPKDQLFVGKGIDQVSSLSYSPDGKTVLVGSDGTASLWDVEAGQELRRFKGHSDAITSTAFSPDGRLVLTGSGDGTTRLWDVKTGEERMRFVGPSSNGKAAAIDAVAFSRDGRNILTAGFDDTARLWDAATGEELRRFVGDAFLGHLLITNSVAFSPDGEQVLTGNYDKTARLWDVESGREIQRFVGHSGGVVSVAFSPDGRRILTGSADKTARIWNAVTGEELQRFKVGSDGVHFAAFSPDGKQVFTNDWHRTQVWNALTGMELQHFVEGYAAAFAPDGKRVITIGKNVIKLWDVDTGKQLPSSASKRFSAAVSSISVSPSGQTVVTGSANGAVRLWNLATGKQEGFAGHREAAHSVAFSPDGRHVLTGSDDKSAKLWDAETGMLVHSFVGHTGRVDAVAFSPDGREILTGSYDGTARLWTLKTGKLVRVFQTNGDTDSVAFSPDGRSVLTGVDGLIKVWDPSSGKQRSVVRTSDSFSLLALSPDGCTLLVSKSDASDEGRAELWDLESEKLLQSFEGFSGPVHSGAFSADGRTILTGSDVATLWDLETGKVLKVLDGGASAVYSVRFSPDGRTIFTDDDEGCTTLWDASTGAEKAKLVSFSDGGWATLAPDGRFDTNEFDGQFPIHWVFDAEPFRAFPVDLFAHDYFTPGLLARIINGNKFPPIPAIGDIKNRVQPNVEIINVNASAVSPSSATLSVRVSSVTDRGVESGIQDLRVFRDGQLVAYREGSLKDGIYTFDNIALPLSKRSVTFTAYAFNSSRVKSSTAKREFAYSPQARVRPRAYLLQVGVDHYQAANCELRHSASDAQIIHRALEQRLKARGFDVRAVELISAGNADGATKERIRNALETIAKQARPDDVFFMSFSGHGYSSPDGSFNILPSDVQGSCDNADDPLLQSAISSDLLANWLRPIDANNMTLILDSYQSAKSKEFELGLSGSQDLGQLAFDKRMRILVGNQSDGETAERPKLQQSLLSYLLIRQGLEEGKGNWRPVDEKITVSEWLSYAVDQVIKLRDSGDGKSMAPNPLLRDIDKAGVGVPMLFDFSKNDDLVI